MKVQLAKPAPQIVISSLVLLDKGKDQLSFVNASRCVIVSSKAYRQSFSVWQKEQEN